MTIEVSQGEWRLVGKDTPDEIEAAIIRRCELHVQLGIVSSRLSDLHVEYRETIAEIMSLNDQLRSMGVDTQWLAAGLQPAPGED